LNLRTKVVSVSLRSVQDQRPPDVVDPLRFGRPRTNVHWTFCGLRSVTVGARPRLVHLGEVFPIITRMFGLVGWECACVPTKKREVGFSRGENPRVSRLK